MNNFTQIVNIFFNILKTLKTFYENHIDNNFRAMRPYAWTKLVGAAARNRVFWPVVDSYIEIGARRSGIIDFGVIF